MAYTEWHQEDGATLYMEARDDGSIKVTVMGPDYEFESRDGHKVPRRDGEDSEFTITEEIASELIMIFEERNERIADALFE